MTRRVKSKEKRRSPYKATQEQLDFLKQRYGKVKISVLVDEYNKLYQDNPITPWQIYRFNYKYGWKEKIDVGPRPYTVWTDEMIEFCKQNAKGISYRDMASLLNEKFGTNLLEEQVSSLYSRYKITNDCPTAFHKGHVPANKGKKWEDYLTPEQMERCRKGQYKKGNVPYCWKPVGTIVTKTSEGKKPYNWIKVIDNHGSNNFMLYSRYVYEQHHGIKLKSDDVIIHLDGNSLNDDINNLMLAKNSENATINKMYAGITDPELKRASILTVRLNKKIKKLEEKK